MSKTIADDSEVVFEQPGKSAGVVEQEGPTPSQSNEETCGWQIQNFTGRTVEERWNLTDQSTRSWVPL